MKGNRIIFILLTLTALLSSCSNIPSDAEKSEERVPMYPDYTDIVIPVNIAPLNFLLRGDVSRTVVVINGRKAASSRGNQITFRESSWKKLLEENAGKDMDVAVLAQNEDGWKEYRHFNWTVSQDQVDPYLTYRIIEPDYEAFNNIALEQRHIGSFKTERFSDCRVIGDKCMNCHTFSGQNPGTSMFYVRGEGGGAILNLDGELQKLSLNCEGWASGSVYFGFSPSSRYIVFSTNKVIPGYHGRAGGRMEVYDTRSDVYVADLENRTFVCAPQISRDDMLETFPCFSPDGKHIYYCTAETPEEFGMDNLKQMKYSLCRVRFDEETGEIGTEIDTVYNALKENHSVCHPRISPDGRFLCFSIADYGTFPLWHMESDLILMDLNEMKLIPMDGANSDKSDTYHSWSSTSRWIVFASKRDDGIYGKPYFTHIDSDGKCSKAFVLPQKHPDFYDNYLRSFNTPELGTGPLPFSAYDVREVLKKESVTFSANK